MCVLDMSAQKLWSAAKSSVNPPASPGTPSKTFPNTGDVYIHVVAARYQHSSRTPERRRAGGRAGGKGREGKGGKGRDKEGGAQSAPMGTHAKRQEAAAAAAADGSSSSSSSRVGQSSLAVHTSAGRPVTISTTAARLVTVSIGHGPTTMEATARAAGGGGGGGEGASPSPEGSGADGCLAAAASVSTDSWRRTRTRSSSCRAARDTSSRSLKGRCHRRRFERWDNRRSENRANSEQKRLNKKGCAEHGPRQAATSVTLDWIQTQTRTARARRTQSPRGTSRAAPPPPPPPRPRDQSPRPWPLRPHRPRPRLRPWPSGG